jgi:cobyrinic acid a,c-diamide synthase
MKSIIIAAPVSGSGKTTVTIGLMECLKRRGLKIAPFKVGPDFIDPGYHRIASGQPSLNLDGWMLSPRAVQEIFAIHAADADIAIIEGVMGLFDGISGRSDEGSTAQIARLTGSTVFLVIDAKGFARSIAALIKGFVEFDSNVRIGGVIFNNVSSENHARILREAVESMLPSISVVGSIPRDSGLNIPSRHLGLLTAEENELSPEYLDHLVEVVRNSMDLGKLWALAGSGNLLELPEKSSPIPAVVKIAVARDKAFCFVYESNLQLLRDSGAELIEFSPLVDTSLPADISGIYLPGGYPEAYRDELSANSSMKGAIRRAIEAGMPVYAECGGFIYLTAGVIVAQDEEISLKDFVGIFPVTTRMLKQRKALGYREIELRTDSILGKKGTVARGHEFHYSETEEMPERIERLYQVSKGQSDLGTEGYRYRNCLASYIHLHFGSNPGMAEALVAHCRQFGAQKATEVDLSQGI